MGALVFASACVSVIPPGGVVWPYYIFMASIPFAAFLYARYDRRVSAVIYYGLLAGFVFAWALFGNDREVIFGITPPESFVLRIGLCTLLMTLLCVSAFAAGLRRFVQHEKRHPS